MALVKNGQEIRIPTLRWPVWVKKLVQENRIRIGTWNIGSLNEILVEIIMDTMAKIR